jgi:hypothetical protein
MRFDSVRFVTLAIVVAAISGGFALGAHTPRPPSCHACDTITQKISPAIDDLKARTEDLKGRVETLEKGPAEPLRCRQVTDRRKSFVKLGVTDFAYSLKIEKESQIAGGGCEASSPSHAVIVSLTGSGPISATDDPAHTIGWKCSANVTSAPARAPIGPVEIDIRVTVIACE